MTKEVTPLRPYVPPAFGGESRALDPNLKAKMWRPIKVGSIIVGVFVVGFLGWAAIAPLNGAVMAAGQVRVEANRKVLRHREGGTVKAILVKEGQRVRAGQPLLLMDEVQAKAAVDVLQNQEDVALAQSARFQAESRGLRTITFPPSLTSRMTDPRVAGLIRDQQLLFSTRMQFLDSQSDVLNQRSQQLETQIGGVKSQIDSIDEQARLIQEELDGYKTLYEKGFAPKTLILRYDRTLAELQGRRGGLVSDTNKLRQQIGETRLQLVTLREQNTSQAAEGLRQMQAGLADVSPKLAAARQMMEHTTVSSPADGYVLELTQHTIGGVVGPGELLMEIVPANSPLIVSARIRPQDIDDVTVGMKAKVSLSAYNSRKVPSIHGTVTAVSADQIADPKTGIGYFVADVRIPPEEFKKLPKHVKMSPGMPAEVMIETGKRTILAYVLSPLTDTLHKAGRED